MKNRLPVLIGSTFVLGVSAIFTSMSLYKVDAGELAIVTKYGKIVDQNDSGLNWKSPVEDVTYFSTREAKMTFGSFDSNTGDVSSGLSAYTAD